MFVHYTKAHNDIDLSLFFEKLVAFEGPNHSPGSDFSNFVAYKSHVHHKFMMQIEIRQMQAQKKKNRCLLQMPLN